MHLSAVLELISSTASCLQVYKFCDFAIKFSCFDTLSLKRFSRNVISPAPLNNFNCSGKLLNLCAFSPISHGVLILHSQAVVCGHQFKTWSSFVTIL